MFLLFDKYWAPFEFAVLCVSKAVLKSVFVTAYCWTSVEKKIGIFFVYTFVHKTILGSIIVTASYWEPIECATFCLPEVILESIFTVHAVGHRLIFLWVVPEDSTRR